MKKAIIAIAAAVCVLAILVVCAIVFKPEEKEETPAQTMETLEPGYYEEEEITFPSIPITQ